MTAHLIAAGADELTLCGIPYRDPRRYPLVAVQHLPAHHRGHGETACDVCAGRWARALTVALTGTGVHESRN